MLTEDTTTAEDETEVAFRGRIPKALHDRFIQRFPWHGSNQWVITELLTAFMDRVEREPTFEAIMAQALDEHIAKRRNSR